MNGTGWDDQSCTTFTAPYIIEYECQSSNSSACPRTFHLSCVFPLLTHSFSVAVLYNGHYYQIAPFQATFASAINQASQATYKGQLGYLATISSKPEYDFIDSVLGARNVWLAVTDGQEEGKWLTAAGPSIGTEISAGVWAFGEPFGGPGENCAYSLSNGLRDSNCNLTRFYVIEYECQTVSSASCECKTLESSL
jgi:hypothetical protein